MQHCLFLRREIQPLLTPIYESLAIDFQTTPYVVFTARQDESTFKISAAVWSGAGKLFYRPSSGIDKGGADSMTWQPLFLKRMGCTDYP